MESEQVELGTLIFRIDTSAAIEPSSARAKKIADALAKSLNARLFEAAKDGILKYAIRSEVAEVRAGSLIVFLQLHADVIFNTAVATALAKFVKDYPKIRAGVLGIAKDIKQVSLKSRIFIERKFATQLQEEKLLAEERVEIRAHAVEAKVHSAKAIKEARLLADKAEAERPRSPARTRRGKSEPMA